MVQVQELPDARASRLSYVHLARRSRFKLATTRRLSGLNASQPGGAINPTYEAYDNFKKKHLAQNREIIHKNSELNKTNAELNRTITLLRAERLSLKGSHFQLECENASLRTKLERAEDRERELLANQAGAERTRWGGIDQEQVETMRRSLASAIATLQACGSILPSTGEQQLSFVGSSPATPSPPTPASASASSSSSTSSLPPNHNVSVSRRRSIASRTMRESMTARPDLSYISEGGEGSTELDDGAESDRGWGGPVLEGLREESQPSSQPSSSYSSPAVPAPLASTSLSDSPQHTEPTSPTFATLSLSSDVPSSSASTSKPPSKSRAPPAAPSSTANQQNIERRPGRRTSGLVRPPPTIHAANPASAPKSRGRGRSSMDVGAYEENDAPARPNGKGKEKEREALVEVQPPIEPRKPTTRRVSRALSISSEDEDDVEEQQEQDLDELAALEEPSSAEEEEAAEQSACEEEQEIVRPPTPSPPRPMRPPPTLSAGVSKVKKAAAVAAETVSGAASKPKARKVAELVAVSEETGPSQPSSRAEEEEAAPAEPQEGRRARKSVNYALPKLNTKMRRPQDYVPVTSTAHTSTKPRKSTKAPSSAVSSFSALHSVPRSTSSTHLGGSEKKSSAAGTPSPAMRDYDDEDSGEEEAEISFPKRTASSKVGQEIEERRKERVAAKELQVGAKIGRRHSMAA